MSTVGFNFIFPLKFRQSLRKASKFSKLLLFCTGLMKFLKMCKHHYVVYPVMFSSENNYLRLTMAGKYNQKNLHVRLPNENSCGGPVLGKLQ